MKTTYDKIGINYATKRKNDPRIAIQIFDKLKSAERIINIGAGTGSYEPKSKDLIAIEPSLEMIKQRPKNAYPVVQAVAESLPFPDNYFSHAMTVLSLHHWSNLEQAFQEINRVTRDQFIAVTWNPKAEPFWLTKDYFPEIIEVDRAIFPHTEVFENHFDKVLIEPILIPEDCKDGFLAAYWKRPTEYLNNDVRNSISSFLKLPNISKGLQRLKSDIESRDWHKKNKVILSQSTIDVGYVLITASITSKS